MFSLTHRFVPHCTDQLACVKTFNGAFEDWDFDVESFGGLATPAVAGMYELLRSMDELESMTLILQTISILVARVGKSLSIEAANAVVQPLLQIWEGADEKNVLRKYVLSILTSVTGVVRPEDAKVLYSVVHPMLDVATAGGDAHVYLTDDALRLWLALMRVAKGYDEGFHMLFPRLMTIVVNMDWEHLKVCMLILETYVYVGGEIFLRGEAQLMRVY